MSMSQAQEPSTSLHIRPLTPAIGAEILDVDLARFDAQMIADIRATLLDYKVVFFRDQNLTRAEHIAFARQFGDLEIHPATPKAVSYTHLTLPTIYSV